MAPRGNLQDFQSTGRATPGPAGGGGVRCKAIWLSPPGAGGHCDGAPLLAAPGGGDTVWLSLPGAGERCDAESLLAARGGGDMKTMR